MRVTRGGPDLTSIAVMERDYRLTGKMRGQSDTVAAPAAFEGWFDTVRCACCADANEDYSEQQMEGLSSARIR